MGVNTDYGFIEYRHIRPKGSNNNGLGGVTLRFEVDQEFDHITISWAICNPTDNFNKAIGRETADAAAESGRLLAGQYLRCFNLVDNAIIQIKHAIESKNTPSEFRRELELLLRRISDIISYNTYVDAYQ